MHLYTLTSSSIKYEYKNYEYFNKIMPQCTIAISSFLSLRANIILLKVHLQYFLEALENCTQQKAYV